MGYSIVEPPGGRTTMKNLNEVDDVSIPNIDATEARLTSKTDDTNRQVERLEKEIVKLNLINQVLWKIVKRTHNLDDAFLENAVKKLQEAKGVTSGKLPKRQATNCANCGKKLTKSQDKCLYCGQPAEEPLFF